MKTYEEISEKCDNSKSFFGFDREVLLPYLPYEHAKKYLKEGVTEDDWKKDVKPFNEEAILAEMKEYMAFAWGKVEDHRGISAGRSVEKIATWLWILGDDPMVTFVNDDANYPQYGAPALAEVCKKYNFDIPNNDMLRRMIAGEPCHNGCDGCGK